MQRVMLWKLTWNEPAMGRTDTKFVSIFVYNFIYVSIHIQTVMCLVQQSSEGEGEGEGEGKVVPVLN
jgi:hypothetical protein